MTGLKFHSMRLFNSRAVTRLPLVNSRRSRELLLVQPLLKSRLCPSSGGKTVPSRPGTANTCPLPLKNLAAPLTLSCSEAQRLIAHLIWEARVGG